MNACREEDVESHGGEAELLAGLIAPDQQHVDHHVDHGPRAKNDVDLDLGLIWPPRRHVVEDPEDDQEQPAEQDRSPLADQAPLGVEGGVDGPGAELLLPLGLRLDSSHLRGHFKAGL
jgi:hypothetical protein